MDQDSASNAGGPFGMKTATSNCHWAATPAGVGSVLPMTGGVAALDPRLMAVIPSG